MEIIFKVIIITTISGVGGTGMGGILAAVLGRHSDRIISILLGFAAGVMTGVVCLDLLPGSLMPEGTSAPMNVLTVAAGVLSGFLAIYLLNRWIDSKTASSDSSSKAASMIAAGAVMAVAIALHNLPEGMVIGASFANGSSSASLSRSGIIMAAVMGLHDVPEGMAVSAPLISGGMGAAKAAALAAASGVPTVLGAVFGYYIGAMNPLMLSLSLAFAGGAMLYVVFGELMPESVSLLPGKIPAFSMIAGVLAGMVIVFA